MLLRLFFIFKAGHPGQFVVIEAVPLFEGRLSVFMRLPAADHPTEGIQGGAATRPALFATAGKDEFLPRRAFRNGMLQAFLRALNRQNGSESIGVGVGHREVFQVAGYGLLISSQQHSVLLAQAQRDQPNQNGQEQNTGYHAQHPIAGNPVAAAMCVEPLVQPPPGLGGRRFIQAVLIISEKIEYISFACHIFCLWD